MFKSESKIVFIKRVPNRRPVRGEGDDPSYDRSFIGSSLKNGRVLNPLMPTEEVLLMPSLVATSPSNQGWETAIKDYWANIRKEVPFKGGLELEVGVQYMTEEAYKNRKP